MTQLSDEQIDGLDGPIIWRWTPPDELRSNKMADVAQEYAIESNPEALSGILVHAKYHDEWTTNPFTTRPVIAELLRQQQPTLAALIDGLRLDWVDEFEDVQVDGEIHSVHLQSDVATPLGDYRVIGNDCYVSIGENRWRQIAAGESRDNAKMLGELDYKQRVRAIFKGV